MQQAGGEPCVFFFFKKKKQLVHAHSLRRTTGVEVSCSQPGAVSALCNTSSIVRVV